jgi:hypothetical protein
MVILKAQYSAEKFDIDKSSIKNFYLYEDERRQLRTGKVASIRSQFGNGDKLSKHFDSPLVVNKKDNEKFFRVIDGNHRIEAIKQKLEKDNTFSIEVRLFIYKNLTRDEEREIYSKWQKGIPQSATDYLACYVKTIPLMDKMLETLPVSLYKTPKKISIKVLMGCHIKAKKQRNFDGGYACNGEQTVADFKEITSEDIKIVKAFLKDYEQVFGEYMKGNIWYCGGPMFALYRIWYDNKQFMPNNKLISIWKKALLPNRYVWNGIITSSTRESTKAIYVYMLDALNASQTRIHWKSYKEIIPNEITATDVEEEVIEEE